MIKQASPAARFYVRQCLGNSSALVNREFLFLMLTASVRNVDISTSRQSSSSPCSLLLPSSLSSSLLSCTPCCLQKVFNSRATQLVLGAGAIHSAANLKSISAKHLALCSQSLGLVLTLIPHMRAALATCLPQKHRLLLAQMDTVAQVGRLGDKVKPVRDVLHPDTVPPVWATGSRQI